jgi:hypothetical protein
MAYNQSETPEARRAKNVQDYVMYINSIKGGHELLQAVKLGDGTLSDLLEGTEYYDWVKKLNQKIKKEEQELGIKHSEFMVGVARFKLQQRCIKDSGVNGKLGLNVISKKSTPEETIKAQELFDTEEDDTDSMGV